MKLMFYSTVYHSSIPEDVIRLKAIELNNQSFNNAASREEYLDKIAEDLARAEYYYSRRLYGFGNNNTHHPSSLFR